MKNRSPAATPLRILFTLGAAGSLSDGDLLRRYLDGRADEAECAFAVLVERHGAMVRHVCLSILGNPDDAADAYQATFLVLARRAGAIRKAGSVGPWLFGVARRVALRARSRSSRRRQAERSLAEHSATQPTQAAPDPSHPDDWAVLYDELDRLPPRYRDPLVLCYLQGMTHDQASALLGIPTPTLRTRLSRARDRLRPRLVRRGLTPSSASSLLLAPVPLTSPAASLASIGWASAASRLAVASRGASLASLSVPLATSTLRSMLMISAFRTLSLGGIALLGIGAGAAGLASWGGSGNADPMPDPPPGVAVLVEQDPVAPGPDQADLAADEAAPSLLNTPWEIAPARVHAEIRMPLEIRSILPQGTVVSRDQVICELDTTSLRDQLASQQIATERSEADYQNAIKDREIAEVTVRRYLQGVFPLEEFEAMAEVKLAHSELDVANARLARVARNAPEDERAIRILKAKVGVQRAELALGRAEKALEVLKAYTYELRIKSLEGDVEKAKAEEWARKSSFELEKEREELLRRTIEKAQIKAPADGILSLAVGIREGVTIREGQLLFEILPPADDEEAPTEPERSPFELDPPDPDQTRPPGAPESAPPTAGDAG
ncbi:sigma-70 family RNA polymerase sigma factor [Tautonia sp. JC769]|uniref:sigma-70 family RNA polymerase sigma factor n=1 Tax=Tautonia sp. JC769 TaxID=3232135 RepID=UPI003457E806